MNLTVIKRVSCIILALILVSFIAANVIAAEKKETLVGKTVNINTATVDDFTKNVPLMTKELAEGIVNYREEFGDFQVIEELLQVEGFDRGLLMRIRDFLLLEGLGGDDCTC